MFKTNIKQETKENENFRKVIVTGKNAQVVLMCLKKGEEIGAEVHETIDQAFFFVKGEGQVLVNNESQRVEEHDMVYVNAGSKHNVINLGEEDLKFYTVYSPPAHKDGTVHKTKEEAEKEEHY